MEAHVQGKGGAKDCIVFLGGWPDDYTIWDFQVSHFSASHRCIAIQIPGLGVANNDPSRAWGWEVEELLQQLKEVILLHSEGNPVTLVTHDWGAVLGYEFIALNQSLVKCLIALDVGMGISFWNIPGLCCLFTYQFWLLISFLLGSNPVTNAITALVARVLGWPFSKERRRALNSSMNYLYFTYWKMIFKRGFGGQNPRSRMLFLHGSKGYKKWVQFFNKQWLDGVKSKMGSTELELPHCGHWMMVEDPDLLNELMTYFLDKKLSLVKQKAREMSHQG
ncbi:unnamed protein product [Chrysoparadoxa australica]